MSREVLLGALRTVWYATCPLCRQGFSYRGAWRGCPRCGWGARKEAERR